MIRFVVFLFFLLASVPSHAANFGPFMDDGAAIAACRSWGATAPPATQNPPQTIFCFVSTPVSLSGIGTVGRVNGTWKPAGNDSGQLWYYPLGAKCADRNSADSPAALGSPDRSYSGDPPTCIVGCSVEYDPGRVTTMDSGHKVTSVTGMHYSGDTCSSPDPRPHPGPDDGTRPACNPAGNGQTFCIRPDGQHCTTSSKGNTFCWSPGETGEKSGGDELAKRSLGSGPKPPTTPPPPNAANQFDGGHDSDVKKDNISTIFNTSIFSQSSPSNPNPTNVSPGGAAGPPGTTSPGTSPSGDSGSVSGGSCSTNYACSGNVIECAQLVELNKARCALTPDRSISGGSTCAPADAPVCSGSECNAVRYSAELQQWKSRCAVEGLGKDLKGIHDGLTGTDGQIHFDDPSPVSGEAAGVSKDRDVGADGLDSSGFLGGGSCPVVPDVSVFGATLHFNTAPFCDFLAIGGQLVLLFAALFSLKILGSVS